MRTMRTKTCPRCGQKLPASRFRARPDPSGQLQSMGIDDKDCHRLRTVLRGGGVLEPFEPPPAPGEIDPAPGRARRLTGSGRSPSAPAPPPATD